MGDQKGGLVGKEQSIHGKAVQTNAFCTVRLIGREDYFIGVFF